MESLKPPVQAAPSEPALPLPARRAAGYHVANALSYLINPLVLPPVAFGLIQAHFGAPPGEIAWTVGVALVFFCLVPLFYVLGMIRLGRIDTIEVRQREQRLGPLLVGAFSYLLGMALLGATLTTARTLIVCVAGLFPVNALVLLLINRHSKISLHMASLAAFISILLFVALTVWRDLPDGWEALLTLVGVVPLLVLVPVLMWARVRVGAHTPGQVAAGAAFGLAVPFAELWILIYGILDLAG